MQCKSGLLAEVQSKLKIKGLKGML